MLEILIVLVSLNLLVAVIDLIVDVRNIKPVRKRAMLVDFAKQYVMAAEQRGGSPSDKRVWATARLMEHGVKNTQAEALVEHAIAVDKRVK